MAITQRLDMRQGQSLVMTPQLQQAIKLLQMNNLELNEFVEAELERNPLLERDERSEAGGEENEPPAKSAESRKTHSVQPAARAFVLRGLSGAYRQPKLFTFSVRPVLVETGDKPPCSVHPSLQFQLTAAIRNRLVFPAVLAGIPAVIATRSPGTARPHDFSSARALSASSSPVTTSSMVNGSTPHTMARRRVTWGVGDKAIIESGGRSRDIADAVAPVVV